MLINNTLHTHYKPYSPPPERPAAPSKPEATERVVEGELLRERTGRDQEWFSRAFRRSAAEAAASPAARQAIHAYLDHASDDEGGDGVTPRRVDYYV